MRQNYDEADYHQHENRRCAQDLHLRHKTDPMGAFVMIQIDQPDLALHARSLIWLTDDQIERGQVHAHECAPGLNTRVQGMRSLL